MKLNRDEWTPLTILIETREEAEILHKVLAYASDDTDERDAHFLRSLFMALGKGVNPEGKYRVVQSAAGLTVQDGTF